MEISRHWRLKKQRYGLAGEACLRCDRKFFPPRGICPDCGGRTGETPAAGVKLIAFTTIYKPAATTTPIPVSIEQPVVV